MSFRLRTSGVECAKYWGSRERTFVVRSKNGVAEWISVQKGAVDGDLIRINGAIKAGDIVVKRATDEIREGTQLKSGSK
jgi:membrane fusion protein, multidrug efflux system